MSIQDWALSWFNQTRNIHCVEDVIIETVSGMTAPIRASIIDPESFVNSNELKTKTDKTMFIFNTADLSGIRIARGVRIHRGSVKFEVVIDKTVQEYYNDPNENETVVPAKRLCS